MYTSLLDFVSRSKSPLAPLSKGGTGFLVPLGKGDLCLGFPPNTKTTRQEDSEGFRCSSDLCTYGSLKRRTKIRLLAPFPRGFGGFKSPTEVQPTSLESEQAFQGGLGDLDLQPKSSQLRSNLSKLKKGDLDRQPKSSQLQHPTLVNHISCLIDCSS